jgi:hypothetical protein
VKRTIRIGHRTIWNATRGCEWTTGPKKSAHCSTRWPRHTTPSTRITDGEDPDWASWYADWLVNHSELPDLLDVKPVRSELVYMLVRLDKKYLMESPDEKFEGYYARGLLEHFRKV